VWRGAYHCKHVVRCLAERAAPADAPIVAALAVLRGLYAPRRGAGRRARATAPARRAA
jgi:hypothetical protein